MPMARRRKAAAALNEIDYQNDFPKIEFRDAIYDVVRDLSERGIDALKEWLTKLNIKPQKIAETERLARAFRSQPQDDV